MACNLQTQKISANILKNLEEEENKNQSILLPLSIVDLHSNKDTFLFLKVIR